MFNLNDFRTARFFLLISILFTMCYCAANAQTDSKDNSEPIEFDYMVNDCFWKIPCTDTECALTQMNHAHDKVVIRYVTRTDTLSPDCHYKLFDPITNEQYDYILQLDGYEFHISDTPYKIPIDTTYRSGRRNGVGPMGIIKSPFNQ